MTNGDNDRRRRLNESTADAGCA